MTDGLDPDRAAAAARTERHPAAEARPVRDPASASRRAGAGVAVLGAVLVAILTVHGLSHGGGGDAGIAPGHPLVRFVAPLAGSGLSGDANVRPRCAPGAANPRALNVCGRGLLVLLLFSPRSGGCVAAVDALSALAPARHPGTGETPVLAALAVASSAKAARRAIAAHRWRIPVAFDRDGAIGELYGGAVCPLFEVARGSRVIDRLIGEEWNRPGVLRARLLRDGVMGAPSRAAPAPAQP